MAQSAALQVIGLPKVLKKLDEQISTKFEEEHVLGDLSRSGAATLRGMLSPNFPRTSASVATDIQPTKASINANRYPYVFHERGSQYPVAQQLQPGSTGVRQHRRRTGIRNSMLRVPPRRYLARTKRQTVQKLPAALERAKAAREKAWAA